MIVVDVTVLLAAFDPDHPHHGAARPWLQSALADPAASVIVPDTVWVGFVRLATLRGIRRVPASAAEAFGFLRAVSGAPGYQPLPALDALLDRFEQTVTSDDAVGNLVPDAYIAAIARMFACEVATFDKDFRRFDGVRIVTPAERNDPGSRLST